MSFNRLFLVFITIALVQCNLVSHKNKRQTPPASETFSNDIAVEASESHFEDKSSLESEAREEENAYPTDPAVATSNRLSLAWKRLHAVETDISRSLGIAVEDLCQEVGIYSCIHDTFSTALGGNDPFDKAQYRASQDPSLVTAIAMERLAFSACEKRTQIDLQDPSRKFVTFDLSQTTISADEMDLYVEKLFKIVHGRLPTSEEKASFYPLIEAGMTSENIAVASCVIALTTIEFIFM